MTPREELLEMLRYMRPARSASERKFINRFLMPLPGAVVDYFGNVIVRVGTSPILWSSHTDTVHIKSGKQEVYVDADDYAFVKHNDVLGADCTTGVWLMVHMIRAGVPGLYVFHRDEEIGGRGSDWIVKNTPDLLTGINYAIAFDRKRCDSVVTHQFGQRCCSEAFASSLISVLGGGYTADDTGTFTDTANYVDLIGECTNISVGYWDQHTTLEMQDLQFSDALLDTLLTSDFSGLVAERQPGDLEPRSRGGWWQRYGTYTAAANDDDVWDGQDQLPFATPDTDTSVVEHLRSLTLEHPEIVAAILNEYGVAPDEILSRAYAHH